MQEYKNNSEKAKESEKKKSIEYQRQIPKAEPIVEGKRVKGGSLKSKILSTFIHEDRESVIEYALNDIIIPMIKEATLNVVNGTLSMLFYGEAGKPIINGGKTSYSSISKASYKQNNSDEAVRIKNNGSYHDIITTRTYEESRKILNTMRDRLEQYEMVRVADYYEMHKLSSNFTDNSYGWYNLDSAKILPYGGRWYISLPDSKPL